MTAGRATAAARAALFAATLLVSSALLFVVQPMFGKLVLPRVGATPAAWTTCMLFFQAALLAGYAYAHLVRLPPLAHVALVALPLAVLPIGLAAGSAPAAGGDPTLWLLATLAASVGAPFLALAASAPVLQRWFPGDPYPLYAASNAGSLAGLVGYPLLIEPSLSLDRQATWFAAGYGAFVALALACALAGRRRPAATVDADPPPGPPPSAGATARWIGLAFVPSSLMLGATTYVSTDIAAIPLLWVIPLALYLISFIVVFARPPTRPNPVLVTAFMGLLLPLFLLALTPATSRPALLVAHLGFLGFGAVLFHGELARTRPHPRHLTRFYLALAVGGALGGLWNALAPALFVRITEYPITMALACLLLPRPPAADTVAGDRQRALVRSIGLDPAEVADLEPTADGVRRRQRRLDLQVPLAVTALALVAGLALRDAGGAARALVALAAPIALCGLLSIRRPPRLGLGLLGVLLAANLGAGDPDGVRWRDRSFFGALRVEDSPARPGDPGRRSLIHGTIIHGQQSLDPALRREPIAYYHRAGPVGQIVAALRDGPGRARADVAVIGLGTGALAAHGAPGDRFTFYEIDGAIERVARDPSLFTWLADTLAEVDVVLGDARRSLVAAPTGAYDLLIVDAFSSDAIPTHLLTREALALYLSRTRARGLVALHISSRYLRLEAPLGALARDAGLVGRVRRDREPPTALKVPSAWVVLARRPADLGPIADDRRWIALPVGPDVWTDDFSHLLGALDL